MKLSERREIVEEYAKAVRRRYPQTEQYNILIFGSFLTERYTEHSDIDIGIFSLIPGLSYRLYSFTKDYFERMNIANDVIRMRLLESQYINIPIVTQQNFAATDYCPDELINYIQKMIAMYGTNPLESVVKKLRQEVLA